MQLDATTMEGMAVERTSITDLSVIGEELTEEELSMVCGGAKPVYTGKTYFEDTETWENDFLSG
ncbi:MAG: hypothetical protein M3Q03_08250 [Chloroflexota bacterium]|nr:hypothetical protein [Chloroflexota bacterium]